MIENVHKHILDELRINAKADTMFILSALGLNFTTLAINASIAGSEVSNIITMLVFVVLTIIVCLTAELGLIRGRQASKKLIEGLIKMYEDNNVSRYYDQNLLNHYKLRYNLFILTITVTGIVSIVVPFLNID